MFIVYIFLLCVTALAHLYFWYVESVLWDTPKGNKIFKTTPQVSASSKVLASNQGLYNGLLALGLLVSQFAVPVESALAIERFIFVFIIVVGIYGALTVTKKIFFVQTLPAALALAASFFI